jgi:hypothetical protein
MIEFLFACTTFLSGLYGGIGLFTAMGGNPAISRMSARTFTEFWKYTDHYMGARMPVFGPILLLSVLASTVVMFVQYRQPACWLMLGALLVNVADVVMTILIHLPLNQQIRNWNMEQELPANVADIQQRIVAAFDKRLVLMIVSFAMVLAAMWAR